MTGDKKISPVQRLAGRTKVREERVAQEKPVWEKVGTVIESRRRKSLKEEELFSELKLLTLKKGEVELKRYSARLERTRRCACENETPSRVRVEKSANGEDERCSDPGSVREERESAVVSVHGRAKIDTPSCRRLKTGKKIGTGEQVGIQKEIQTSCGRTERDMKHPGK